MNLNQYKIILKNTSIIVNDYTLGSNKKLEYQFTMFDNLTHKIYYLGLHYDEKNRRLYLPRGIDPWFVESCLDNVKSYTDHSYTQYANIGNICIKTLPRDEKQKQALRFMLAKGEYDKNKYKSQFSVNMPTGSGKTYCSVATIAYESIRSIVITYSNNWLDQWKERILQYTDMDSCDIYKIEGSPSINSLLNGKSKNCNRKIYLVTHGTLKSYGDKYGWERITELFKRLKIGLKFYDEAHLNFTNMCMVDFYTNVYKTYYITATPARSSDNENRIYQLYLKNVPSIDLFDKDTDPHTHYVAFKYNSDPKPWEVSECKGAYGLDRMRYISYLMNKENFWKMFDIIFSLIINSKYTGKALFYIGTNEAIIKVRDHIVSLYPEFEDDIGIYTSLSGDTKNKEKEKRFILSTTKSAGAAEDISGLRFAVLVAEPFKSEVLTKQTLGRTRGENTFYYEMIDLGFSYTKSFYYAKLKIFNTYALSTMDTTLNNYKLNNKYEDIRIKRLNRFKQAIVNGYSKECISFDYTKPKAIIFYK